MRDSHKYSYTINHFFHLFLFSSWNHSLKTTSILILLILTSVMIPGISYDPFCQWIIHYIFRIQIGIITKSIRVDCCYIHYASVLSGMVTVSMFDDQFLWKVKGSFGIYIPQLTKRSRNRSFIFLLLMEDNSSKKPRKEMMVFTQWFRVRGIFFLLYGDVRIIVEDWRFQILFISDESVYWILIRKISIDLIWSLANVIQQKNLMFTMRYKFEDRKKVNSVASLLKKKTFEEKTCLFSSSILWYLYYFMFVVLLFLNTLYVILTFI